MTIDTNLYTNPRSYSGATAIIRVLKCGGLITNLDVTSFTQVKPNSKVWTSEDGITDKTRGEGLQTIPGSRGSVHGERPGNQTRS